MSHPLALTASLALTCGLALPVAASEPTALEGDWVEMVPERPRIGKQIHRDPAHLEVRGHSFVMKHGDRPSRQSLFAVVPDQELGSIDLMTVVGGEFWHSRAIFKVEGETLTLCESVRDAERPREFSGWEALEDQPLRSLTVFKRRVAASPASAGGPDTPDGQEP